MKLFDTIKRNSGLSALKKSLRNFKRDKVVYNLVTARKIAIVGVVNTTTDFDDIHNFQRFLAEKNIQVESLLFFPGKEIPPQLLMRKGITIFDRNEISWVGKPLNHGIDRFCQQEFDILIDLSLYETFTVRWISTLSHAKFKVGCLGYSGNPYDLIMSIDNNKQIPYLCEQIVHYLNLLNNRFAQDKDDYSANENVKEVIQ